MERAFGPEDRGRPEPLSAGGQLSQGENELQKRHQKVNEDGVNRVRVEGYER